MNNYSHLALSKSIGRLHKENSSVYRTSFQRDRDRIIHSASFRRLKHKTQVFVNTEGDHYRTRITHSIEVAQIARSIAKYLGLNDDLSETLSLAHDLGHTPFGHAGEDALNDCMINYGGFDHNLQTLRIVMFLEHKYLKFKGLNLTIETLDGLLKHNGPVADTMLVENLIGLKIFKDKIYRYFLKINKKRVNKAVLLSDFEILSILRNMKIIGIFTRLAIRDKKKQYLKLIPYAWKLIELRISNNQKFSQLKSLLDLNFSKKIRNQK